MFFFANFDMNVGDVDQTVSGNDFVSKNNFDDLNGIRRQTDGTRHELDFFTRCSHLNTTSMIIKILNFYDISY